jgi:hypothetical protein
MSGVFQNIDPPTLSPPGECVPPRLWCGGKTHSLGGEGMGRGSIVWKTPDTALYSVYVSTLWLGMLRGGEGQCILVSVVFTTTPPSAITAIFGSYLS